MKVLSERSWVCLFFWHKSQRQVNQTMQKKVTVIVSAVSVMMAAGFWAGSTPLHAQSNTGPEQYRTVTPQPNTDQLPVSAAAIPGDVNHDGELNIRDLAFVSDFLGSNNPTADVTADGEVDILDLQFIAQLIDHPNLITPPANPQPTPSAVNEIDQPDDNQPVETPTETVLFSVDPELEYYDDAALPELFPDISATPTGNADSTADDSEEEDASDFLNLFDDSDPADSVTEFTEPIPTPTTLNEPSTQNSDTGTRPTATPNTPQPSTSQAAETVQPAGAHLPEATTSAAGTGSAPAPVTLERQPVDSRGQLPAESPVAAANNPTAAPPVYPQKTLEAITCQHNTTAPRQIDICTIVFAGLAYGSGMWIADTNADGLVDKRDLDALASEYRRPFSAAGSPP